MNYTLMLIDIASKFNQPLQLEHDSKNNVYKVSIQNVRLKEKYVRIFIYGKGTTISDACYDYLRLARSYELIHDITEQAIMIY